MGATEGKFCVIIGGGGHAAVLIDILQMSGLGVPHAILDSDPSKWGDNLFDVPILGDDNLLPELLDQGVSHFLIGLGSTEDNRPRRRLFEMALSCKLEPLTVKHPGAFCCSIINARAILGVNVIVNSGAIVEHDCAIGDHVHVATGARLASTVRVGSGAHIGAGATVRQLISIGEGAVVGAGAVVVKDVPAWTVVMGVAARPVRSVENSTTYSPG
jgi:UDP-perosamine 4-acetyltransferase